jgi:hypothetical protein
MSQICSQKTNVPADFWEKNPLQCVQLITKSFYAMVVVIESILYCWLFYMIVKYIIFVLTFPCKKKKIQKTTGKKVMSVDGDTQKST